MVVCLPSFIGVEDLDPLVMVTDAKRQLDLESTTNIQPALPPQEIRGKCKGTPIRKVLKYYHKTRDNSSVKKH